MGLTLESSVTQMLMDNWGGIKLHIDVGNSSHNGVSKDI